MKHVMFSAVLMLAACPRSVATEPVQDATPIPAEVVPAVPDATVDPVDASGLTDESVVATSTSTSTSTTGS